MIVTSQSRLLQISAALTFLLAWVVLVPGARADGPCAGASHIATQAEANSAANGGIIAGVSTVCEGDAALGVNKADGTAKMYLKSLPRTGSATSNTNIDMLNGAFAVCASNFFNQYQKLYGAVTITSAYRSQADEAKLCVDNPRCGASMNVSTPTSLHTQGLALDVTAKTQTTLAEFAKLNPQFGVCFPFTGTSGFSDPVHMILAGTGSAETKGAGCAGVTKACSAGNFNPNAIVPVAQQTPRPYAPIYSSSYPIQPSYISSPIYPQPMPAYNSLPVPVTIPPSTSSGGGSKKSGGTVSPPVPIYASSTASIPSAALIIAQSTKVKRGASTLISWTSVGMIPSSCTITQAGKVFGTGPQGGAILGPSSTSVAGAIPIVFDCTSYAGIDNKRTISIVVE